MSTILYFKASDEGVADGQRTINIVTSDTLSTATAAGWANAQGLELLASDVIDMTCSFIQATQTGSVAVRFYVTISGSGIFTLTTNPSQTVLTSAIALPDVGPNLVSFNVVVGQAALASAGHVALITSSGAKQYKLISLQMSKGGTNFSGGSGDRLGQVTDGTTVYSVIPATNMQTLVNAGWGISTPLPFPASAAINTSTVAGANLYFAYSGGTTDYTAGSLTMSGLVQRVA